MSTPDGCCHGETPDSEDHTELKSMTQRLWVCIALALPLLLLSMESLMPTRVYYAIHNSLTLRTTHWLQLILASPVVLWGGWPFFEKAWASIQHRAFNMFTLIGIGTGVAYLYSLIATLFPHVFPSSFHSHHGDIGLYFEAAAVITTLVIMGQILEMRARSQANQAIRSLLQLSPKTARLIHENGQEEDIPLDQVKVGNLLRIRPGEKIPTDGVIVEIVKEERVLAEGEAPTALPVEGATRAPMIDESMITGESVPVTKKVGELVIGATLNGLGTFVMKAERIGQETVLAQIIQMVQEAQKSRAPVQKLADQVASYFVPGVLIISLATFLLWTLFGPKPSIVYAVINAVSVLIIACPCALGLATPISILVASGRGASAGVLIKSAEALEVLEKMDILVVDKTGTITEGKPRVVGIESIPGYGESEILQLAAALESGSEHPLALAVLKEAHDKNIKPVKAESFESVTGMGVVGRVKSQEVVLGNEKLFVRRGVSSAPLRKFAENFRLVGQTAIFMAINKQPVAVLGVADPIKASTAEAIKQIKGAGIRVIMVTGDSFITAKMVGKQLGITEIEAEVSPARKIEMIKKLRWQGHVVGMAGDGINDAPALAQASVGIAMGTGTDVAMKSAGITLIKGDLRGIARARKLSQATMKNIRQNLFFAFSYNALGIPIAAGILYPFLGILLNPMIASAAMSLSSVSVIVNALRLKKVVL